MAIYDAAMRYQAEKAPLLVLAGKEYGTGSSRDWAAKGTALLGVRAVIAESFERIHRSNLVGMGVLPLQFNDGETRASARAHRHARRSRSRGSALEDSRRGRLTVTARGEGRREDEVRSPRPHRYPEGEALLRARRHPALRAAAARVRQAGGVTRSTG